MNRILFFVALCLPVLASAETALSLSLKDGQRLDAQLLKYDDYFVSVSNRVGTTFDIPWAEIASVDSPEQTADLMLMKGRLTADASPVGSSIEARKASRALAKALWPGILVHGSGHRYAGDNDTFVSLVGAELFGVVVGGFGVNELLGPGKAGEHKDTALALAIGGGAIFGLTWLWDIAFAPGAVRRFNAARGLALEPAKPGGAQIALRF